MQWCWQDLRWERALLESPLPPRPIRGGLTFDGAGAMPTSSSEQRLSTLQSPRHISPGPIPPARLRSFLLACRVSCPHPPCKHRLLANHWLGMNSLSFQLYLPPCCLEWGGGGEAAGWWGDRDGITGRRTWGGGEEGCDLHGFSGLLRGTRQPLALSPAAGIYLGLTMHM